MVRHCGRRCMERAVLSAACSSPRTMMVAVTRCAAPFVPLHFVGVVSGNGAPIVATTLVPIKGKRNDQIQRWGSEKNNTSATMKMLVLKLVSLMSPSYLASALPPRPSRSVIVTPPASISSSSSCSTGIVSSTTHCTICVDDKYHPHLNIKINGLSPCHGRVRRRWT